MDAIVLDDISFELDLHALASKARVREDSGHMADLEQLARDALAIARPKAMYKVAYIDARRDDEVVIDGFTFASRVLRINLEQAHRVFMYVATCGMELHNWAVSLDDLLWRYWAESVQLMALRGAQNALNEDIEARHRPGRTSAMAPGSLGDWPLREQRPLFAALGSVAENIGVELSPSLLMIPAKSVSGIRFPTEESFESCQLCPREECPGRRAPYDSQLADRKYGLRVTRARG